MFSLLCRVPLSQKLSHKSTCTTRGTINILMICMKIETLPLDNMYELNYDILSTKKPKDVVGLFVLTGHKVLSLKVSNRIYERECFNRLSLQKQATSYSSYRQKWSGEHTVHQERDVCLWFHTVSEKQHNTLTSNTSKSALKGPKKLFSKSTYYSDGVLNEMFWVIILSREIVVSCDCVSALLAFQ